MATQFLKIGQVGTRADKPPGLPWGAVLFAWHVKECCVQGASPGRLRLLWHCPRRCLDSCTAPVGFGGACAGGERSLCKARRGRGAAGWSGCLKVSTPAEAGMPSEARLCLVLSSWVQGRPCWLLRGFKRGTLVDLACLQKGAERIGYNAVGLS